MRQKIYFFLLFCLPFALPTLAQNESSVELGMFDSDLLGRTYHYQHYLPANYDENSAYPVVYLLHGRGDTMAAWLRVRTVLDTMIANGDIPPMIAIMPDMLSSRRGHYYVDSQYTGTRYRAEPVETAFFDELIPYVDATYATIQSPEGRIIGGYSMGGYGAIRYALSRPGVFGGAIVLSPAVYTPLPPADSSTREFGAFGKDDALFDEETYRSLNYPALLEDFATTQQRLNMFIAVGDDEWKHPDPEDYEHDIDLESHFLFNRVSRINAINADLRVYDGGHDWTVWERGFVEGLHNMRDMLRAATAPAESAAAFEAQMLGTPGDEWAGGIAYDSEGNKVIALAAAGDMLGQVNQGEGDVILAKYSPDDELLWAQALASSATERAYGLVIDSQDNIIVTGYTNGNLDDTHPDNAADDAFAASFSADGTRNWITQLGDVAHADRSYGIALAPDDNIVIIGYTKGELGAANAGDKDIFIARLSNTGDILWIQQFGGVGEDKGQAIAVHAQSGAIYAAGMTGSELENLAGHIDGWLARYDENGQRQWLRQYGTDKWDEATGIATDAQGMVYVAGFTEGALLHEPAGDKDMVLAQYDANGELRTLNQPGTPANDKAADVRVDENGHIYLVGFSNGSFGIHAGGFDLILLRYPPGADGTPEILQIGSEGDEAADEWAEENVYITLQFNQLAVIGRSMTLNNGGDVFFTELEMDQMNP